MVFCAAASQFSRPVALKNQPPAQQPPAPPAAPPADTVQVTTYLQDPWVAPLVTREVPRQMVGTELSNSRVQITDTRPKVTPDQAGNYLMQPGSDGDSQVNAQVVTSNTLGMWQNYRGGPVE